MTSPSYTGAEMVGGPLDGEWRDLGPTVPGTVSEPLSVFEITAPPPVHWKGPEDSLYTPRVGVYEREPSPRDTGPLWLYRWRGWKDEQA